MLGGVAILMQSVGISKNSPVHLLPVALLVTCMAAIGLWVAFGPGERAFNGSIGFLSLSGPNESGEVIGRVAFAIGATITSAVALMIWRELCRRLRSS